MAFLRLGDRSLRRNVGVAAIVVVMVALYFYGVKFHGNITGFFRIGSVLPLSPYLNSGQVLIHPGEIGYDGQMFLSLGLDPGLRHEGTIAALDLPLYRYRRIFYPLLGYLLGLGNPALIPYSMVAINCACVVALVGLASWGLKQSQEPKWYPLMLLAVPGLWMTLGFSTADLLSSTCLMLAICGYRYGLAKLVGGAMAAACLTRETMAIGWLALVICGIRDRNWKQVMILAGSILPMVGWHLYAAHRLPNPISIGMNSNFGLPLVGLAHKLGAILLKGFEKNNLFEAVCLGGLLLALGVLLGRSRGDRLNRPIFLMGCLYAALMLVGNDAILSYFMGYSRVYMDVFFLLMLTVEEKGSGLKIWPFVLSAFPTIMFVLLAR
jgi:hypothetical protein